eukprot:178555-Rhodomonas_salina.1
MQRGGGGWRGDQALALRVACRDALGGGRNAPGNRRRVVRRYPRRGGLQVRRGGLQVRWRGRRLERGL